jgi:hypothetical protein
MPPVGDAIDDTIGDNIDDVFDDALAITKVRFATI